MLKQQDLQVRWKLCEDAEVARVGGEVAESLQTRNVKEEAGACSLTCFCDLCLMLTLTRLQVEQEH